MKKNITYLLILLTTLAITTEAYSQIILTGNVKDAKGEALVGANVFVAHTVLGTSVDVQGNFRLEVPTSFNDSTLVISSIGFVSQELPMKERRVFNVVLADDAKTLNEVVVTGYQTEERGKILGSVATVGADLIAKLPTSGVDQALQGRAVTGSV